jgi:hypothetical protein
VRIFVLDVERDVLQVTRVLSDDRLRDRHERGVDAQFAVRPKHASTLRPDRLHVIEAGLVGTPGDAPRVCHCAVVRRRRDNAIDTVYWKVGEHLRGVADENLIFHFSRSSVVVHNRTLKGRRLHDDPSSCNR